MTKEPLKFHRDKFGACVYYAGMNQNAPARRVSGLRINNTVEFDPSVTCVVPEVTRLSATTTETQIKHYRHTDGQMMSVRGYEADKMKLQNIIDATGVSRDDEIAATIDLSRLTSEWSPEEEQVEKHVDYEFEIIDIEYPADERLIPLRHIGDTQINYFKVDCERVAINMIHTLCKGANLKYSEKNKRRTYSLEERWSSNARPSNWKIEGENYGNPLSQLNLSNDFTGALPECRDRINEIECAVRDCFDNWVISCTSPKALTVGLMTGYLDKIERMVKMIDTKVRTKNQFNQTLRHIELARLEVLELGGQTVEEKGE